MDQIEESDFVSVKHEIEDEWQPTLQELGFVSVKEENKGKQEPTVEELGFVSVKEEIIGKQEPTVEELVPVKEEVKYAQQLALQALDSKVTAHTEWSMQGDVEGQFTESQEPDLCCGFPDARRDCESGDRARRRSDEALEKRWKHLKDQYRKELKKQTVCRSGSEVPSNSASSWHYFSSMSFLQDQLIPARTMGNLNTEMDTQSARSSNPNITGICERKEIDGLFKFTTHPLTFTKRKRSANVLQEDMLKLEKQKLLLIEKVLSENEANEKLKQDEDYMFLMSILPSMKKLPTIQKLRFWGKINEWLLEAVTVENQTGYSSQPGQ